MNAEKRWLARAQRWMPRSELFAPAGFRVEVIEEREARPFIIEHHYAASYPAARLAVGLFLNARLVGVAVFSVPMNQRVIPKHTGFLPSQGVELGRFVCLPVVGYNGESWFLARALKLLAVEKSEVRSVVSYADPVGRHAGSIIIKPEHWGTIYQASNATYVGRAEPRRLLMSPSGRVISDRALSKLRNEERGWAYCAKQLVTAGAPARAIGESPAEWVRRIEHTDGFNRIRHSGNLTYVFALDDAAKRAVRSLHGPMLPYPRKAA